MHLSRPLTSACLPHSTTSQVARTGRVVTLSAPQRMFANERQTVEEGFAGDVIGLTNPGAFGRCAVCMPALASAACSLCLTLVPSLTRISTGMLYCPSTATVLPCAPALQPSETPW